MSGISPVLVVFTVIAASLGLLTALRPELTRERGGKILAFFTLCIVPVLAVWAGAQNHMERATSTEFCLSCHVMADDKSYVAAAHFQNNLVPREHACFTCHTDYTMFGDYKAKWRGLHHVEVQYFGRIPKPEEIKLYTPFNNRECLHCHGGARSYEEASPHHKSPDLLARAGAGQISCMSSDCHGIVHEVGTIGDSAMWSPGANGK